MKMPVVGAEVAHLEKQISEVQHEYNDLEEVWKAEKTLS